MENRADLHYSRNTVKAPDPKTHGKEVRKHKHGHYTHTGEILPESERQPKVFATLKCIWCNFGFDSYQITCLNCNNCQYCGMIDNRDPFLCYHCGNYLPEELQPTITPLLAT